MSVDGVKLHDPAVLPGDLPAPEDDGARAFGLGTQSPEYQREMVERLRLNFPVLSDKDLRLARNLELPTFEVEGIVLIKRLTLVIRHGRIEHVFYPVFPPDAHAGAVVDWLTHNPP